MIKQSVVSGAFYPDDSKELKQMIDLFFLNAESTKELKPFAVIVPHAGYVYSGQTAAHVYKIVQQFTYNDAIIIAPSHHANHINYFIGDYEGYETPFGELKTNLIKIKHLLKNQEFKFDRVVDLKEHSLEVQLPFLHYINPEIKLIPIIFCQQNLPNAKKLSRYLNEIIDKDTLLIISTDLSHYHPAKIAEEKDLKLIDFIKNEDINGFYKAIANRECEACGFGGLLTLLHMMELFPHSHIDNSFYTHSGKAYGDNSRVVGYWGGVCVHSSHSI